MGEIDKTSISPDEKALFNLIFVEANMYLGNYQFREELNQALAHFKKSRDDDCFGRAKYLHGWLMISLGNHFDAREILLESYAMYKRCDNLFSQGKILNMLSFLCFQLGEVEVAINYMKKSIAIYDELNDDHRKMNITTNLAYIYYSCGRLAEAMAIYENLKKSVPQWSENNRAIYYFQGAVPLALKGDFVSARKMIDKARPLLQDYSRERAIYYENLGWIHLLKGDYPQAEKALNEGARLSMEIAPESALIAQIKRRLADVYLETSRLGEARRATDEAMAVSRKINERVEIAACYRIYARLEVIHGKDRTALKYFKQAIDLFSIIGAGYELAVTRYLAAVSGIYFEGERQALLFLAREYFESEKVATYLKLINPALNSTVGRRQAPAKSTGKPPIIIAANQSMKRLISLAQHVAASEMAVMLSGPTGTGKDLIARYIHHQSGRSGRFVAINAAAIPDSMIEAELFGYRKGSYTGADRDKAGLIEEADQGTLYLNEIADASSKFQSKLLDVLENRVIRRLGETRERQAHFRLIAATNKDLEKRIGLGQFRVDLFHRLHEVPIQIPPLSERLDDIPALLQFFLRQSDVEFNPDSEIFDKLVKILSDRIWPGNIRQFKAEVNRMVLLAKGDLTKIIKTTSHTQFSHGEYLQRLLDQNNWNRRKVARIMGISEGTVRKRIKKYKLSSSD